MKIVLSTLTALLFAGCTQGPQLSSNMGMGFEEFKAAVYREPWVDGVYIVGGDQVVADDAALLQLWQASQQGALSVFSQGGTDIIWNATQRKQMTYCVSEAFGANKAAVEEAMLEATENGWEKMADLKWTHVAAQDANCSAANTAVLFDVNPVDSGGQYLARAFFPNSARGQRNVLIDNNMFTGGGGAVPLKNVLAHELGHTIGFRHGHIRPEADAAQCAEDNNYRAVTPYDSASVMHYPQCNGTSTDLSFTAKDKTGVAALYGAPSTNIAPMAQINSPMDGASVGSNFAVALQIVDDNLKDVELLIDGNSKEIKTTGPFVFQVKGLSVGEHTIDINATDSEGLVTSRTTTVTVIAAGGGGGGGSDSSNPAAGGGEIQGGCASGGNSNAAWALS
jgi:hypothetical protein